MRSIFFAALGLLLFLFVYFLQAQTANVAKEKPDVFLKNRLSTSTNPESVLLRLQDSAFVAKDDALYVECAIRLAKIQRDNGDYDRAQKILDACLVKSEQFSRFDQVLTARIWVWKGLIFRQSQEWLKSRDAYQTGINLFEKQQSLDNLLVFAYKNTAQNYQRFSNQRLSIQYLEAAMRADTAQKYRASILNNLSNAYLLLDSLPEAMRYYKLADSPQCGRDFYDVISFHGSIGADIALKQGSLDHAKLLEQQALDSFLVHKFQEDNILRAYSILAEIEVKQNHKSGALHNYQKALSFAQTAYKGKSREIAKVWIEKGAFHLENKEYSQALEAYQAALIQVFPDFNESNPEFNPSIEAEYQELQAVEAALGKGKSLLKKPRCNFKDQQNAAYCFDLAFTILRQTSKTYGDDADKLKILNMYHEDLRLAAQNLAAMHYQNPDDGVLQRLFVLFEQSKAQTLRDAIHQRQVFDALPDSIAEGLAQMRQEIGIVRSDLLDQRLSSTDASNKDLNTLKQREFALNQAYEIRINTLKQQFSWLSARLNSEKIPAVADIQQQLSDTAAVLSWFDAGDSLYVLIIKKQELTLKSYAQSPDFKQKIKDLLQILPDRSFQENNPDAYYASAYTVYRMLWPSEHLQGIRKVKIIPEGPLCYLPFEALLTRPYQGHYADAPYLLWNCAISYSWSAAEQSGNTEIAHRMLFAAPFEKQSRNNLPLLEKSSSERIKGISVQMLEGPAATVASFLKKADHFGVLHLATHAHAGGKTEPGIEFFDRTLNMPEITAQRFRADLVALSACETNTGQYADGAGVLSLAYAFACAGAQSLAASYWTVNEASTVQLFQTFYTRLLKGADKAQALQDGKTSYLRSAVMDARKAPYYWAAFVLTGADGPIKLEKEPYWLEMLGIAVVAFALVAGIWAMRRRRKA